MESTINGSGVFPVAEINVLKAREGEARIEGRCTVACDEKIVPSISLGSPPLGIKRVAAAAAANEVVEARNVTTDCGCVATCCRRKTNVYRIGVTRIGEGIGTPHGEIAANGGTIAVNGEGVGACTEINTTDDITAVESNRVVAATAVEVAAQGARTWIES